MVDRMRHENLVSHNFSIFPNDPVISGHQGGLIIPSTSEVWLSPPRDYTIPLMLNYNDPPPPSVLLFLVCYG